MSSVKEKKDTRVRITSYDLDEIFPNASPKRKKPISKTAEILDKIAEDQALELQRKYEDSKVKIAMKEVEKKLKESEGEEAQVGGRDIQITPQLAETLAKMPEETRNGVVSSLMTLNSKGGKGQEDMVLLQLLAGRYAQANPQAPAVDIVKFAETMSNQFRLGMELAKQNQPIIPQTNATMEAVNLVKIIADLMKSQQPTTDSLTQFLKDDSLFKRGQEIGLFGGIQKSSAEISTQLGLEAAKYLKDVDFKIEQLKQDRESRQEIAAYQAAAEQQKWAMIQNALSGSLGNVISGMGGAIANRLQPLGVPLQGLNAPVTIKIQCINCGREIITSSDAKRVICPQCNAVLEATQTVDELQASKKQQQQSADAKGTD